jgi:hypothetical protein
MIFLNNPQVLQNGLRDVTLREVNKMLNCALLMLILKSMNVLTAITHISSVIPVKVDFVLPVVSNMPKKELLIFPRMLLM